jgi:hypothetical protein
VTYDDEYCETSIVVTGPTKLLSLPEEKDAKGGKELDPVEYRYKELYVFANDKTCYQVIIGARIAQGKPDIGQSAAECKENWSERYDLGNWNGQNVPDLGQQYTGGSRRGCFLWLKMYEHDSLSAIEAKVTDEDCEYKLALSGTKELFDALPKATPHAPQATQQASNQKVTDQFTVGTPALRQQQQPTAAATSSFSPLLTFAAVAVALTAIGAGVFFVRRRRKAAIEGEPAE